MGDRVTLIFDKGRLKIIYRKNKLARLWRESLTGKRLHYRYSFDFLSIFWKKLSMLDYAHRTRIIKKKPEVFCYFLILIIFSESCTSRNVEGWAIRLTC
ncbi:hypothetical protein SUGI_0388400 [Cryptomeria japonica]|nr:hypothetical protein SUGI_0388400 [Cryptomeria japonica]